MSGIRAELDELDIAVYAAVANTRTPRLDVALGRLSQAADFSKLWLGSGAALALAGGEQGRRAAVNGVASLGLTSAIVNVVLKPLFGGGAPNGWHIGCRSRAAWMPRTRSFPSGHSASAFAFATGVASAAPGPGIALTFLAAIVAYSRVHTGVHYPRDVLAGSTVGVALAPVAVAAVNRYRSRQPDTQSARPD